MRQLVLDTETTGLNARAGDRVVEIGIVELINRRLTGNNLHFYINPEREIDPAALAIHGLTTQFLSDKPKFNDIASQLSTYLIGADLIIHNAPFDMGFLHIEFERIDMPPVQEYCREIIDTLVVAKQTFPGRRNSLDALCERFNINNTHRKLHGALLDATLLAEVYLVMTRGQESFLVEKTSEPNQAIKGFSKPTFLLKNLNLPVIKANNEEKSAHMSILDDIERSTGNFAIWENSSIK